MTLSGSRSELTYVDWAPTIRALMTRGSVLASLSLVGGGRRAEGLCPVADSCRIDDDLGVLLT